MKKTIGVERSIRRKLYRVLRKTGVHKDRIQPGASYREDLNFDRVDWTIFTYFLEKIFNISVEDEAISKFGKVSDTLVYLRANLN